MDICPCWVFAKFRGLPWLVSTAERKRGAILAFGLASIPFTADEVPVAFSTLAVHHALHQPNQLTPDSFDKRNASPSAVAFLGVIVVA
jgi:hypothetical protein